MTIAHIFYIPVVALAGMVLGFIWGRKAGFAPASALPLTEKRAAARAQRATTPNHPTTPPTRRPRHAHPSQPKRRAFA